MAGVYASLRKTWGSVVRGSENSSASCAALSSDVSSSASAVGGAHDRTSASSVSADLIWEFVGSTLLALRELDDALGLRARSTTRSAENQENSTSLAVMAGASRARRGG